MKQKDTIIVAGYLEKLVIVVQGELPFAQIQIEMGDRIQAQLFHAAIFQFSRDRQALRESFQRLIGFAHYPDSFSQIFEYQLFVPAVTSRSSNDERLIEIFQCPWQIQKTIDRAHRQ